MPVVAIQGVDILGHCSASWDSFRASLFKMRRGDLVDKEMHPGGLAV